MSQVANLDDELTACIAAGEAAWPGLHVPRDTFRAHLDARVPHEPAGVPLIDRVRVADLYLACACARGQPEAIAAFEAHVASDIAVAVRSLEVGQALLDDVMQILRVKLFVTGEREPLIATYSGRGSLRGWVRSVAVRTAMKLQHKGARDAPLDDEALAQLPTGEAGPELAHFRRVYGTEFRAAFAAALAALDTRQRTLLRQHFLDHLNIDDLGALYGVHRATIARWLARARMMLLEQTRAGLRTRIGVHDAEVDSVLRLVRSELHLSLSRLLAA